MAEAKQVGEPQARLRPVFGKPGLGRGKTGDLGVRGGEHDDVARRLAEIDGGRSVVDLPRPGREQVHGFSRPRSRLRPRPAHHRTGLLIISVGIGAISASTSDARPTRAKAPPATSEEVEPRSSSSSTGFDPISDGTVHSVTSR